MRAGRVVDTVQMPVPAGRLVALEDALAEVNDSVDKRFLLTFNGSAELRKEFVNSVEDYLSFCADRGEEPEKPYSGKLPLRMSPER